MRKRLDDMVERTAAFKRTAVIWLEEIRRNRGERWEGCPSVAPMFLFKPAVRTRPQNGVSVQILDRFSTLKSRLPHIRPSIASPSSQQPSSAILRPSSASTPPSRCAHAPHQQPASPQQHSGITAPKSTTPQHPLNPFPFLRLFAPFCGQILSLSPSARPIERPAATPPPPPTFPTP